VSSSCRLGRELRRVDSTGARGADPTLILEQVVFDLALLTKI
jgi:hypothetical protein